MKNVELGEWHGSYFFRSEVFKFPKPFAKCFDILNIFANEAFAVFRYVLPEAVNWAIRKYVQGDIRTIALTIEKTKHVAYLNIHGSIDQKHIHSVLLMHGDYGHPYTMLHLAELAQKEKFATFSLYIPNINNNLDFESHNQLLKKSIDKIQSLIEDSKILGVGHSKGAILLANRQFVDLDARIAATCAIGGRLNVPRMQDCKDKVLRGIVLKIYKNIITNPKMLLMQIVPIDDWNASQDSMKVRPEHLCYNVPGMHLSSLYSAETSKNVAYFLRLNRGF